MVAMGGVFWLSSTQRMLSSEAALQFDTMLTKSWWTVSFR